MAKKVTPNNEAIQTKNLPVASKKVVHALVGNLGKNIDKVAAKASEGQARQSATAEEKAANAPTESDAKINKQKAKGYAARSRRLGTLASVVTPKKLTVETSANKLVDLVEQGARDIAPSRDVAGNVERYWKIKPSGELDKNPGKSGKPIMDGVRLPGEALAGAGFYHDKHEEAVSAMPDNPEAAFAATSAASSRASVEDEKDSFEEIVRAHQNGATIHMHQGIFNHLQNAGAAPSPSTIGQRVKIADLPSETVSELANPKIKSLVATHSNGVDFSQMGKTSNAANRLKVIRTVRGETAASESQNPFTAPKTWSFKQNKESATPGTRDEYEARASHLGNVIRGEIHGGQQMFDFNGLRQSNEGILSDTGHTTEDSWMRSADLSPLVPREYPDKKALGELNVSGKTHVINGKKITVSSNPDVGAQSVIHAYGNEATTRASKLLQEKHGVDFTIPATLVQEVAWSSARRNDYKEKSPEFKAAAKEIKEQSDEELKQKTADDRYNARARNEKTGLLPKKPDMLF